MSDFRIIALDIGQKYIGIAITDPLWIFSQPLDMIKKSPSLKIDLEILVNKISSYEIVAIVIGWPPFHHEKETNVHPIIRGMEKKLKKLFSKTLIFRQNEDLSSQEASKILKSNSRKSLRKQKSIGKVDSTAAAVILSSFMNCTQFQFLRDKYIT